MRNVLLLMDSLLFTRLLPEWMSSNEISFDFDCFLHFNWKQQMNFVLYFHNSHFYRRCPHHRHRHLLWFMIDQVRNAVWRMDDARFVNIPHCAYKSAGRPFPSPSHPLLSANFASRILISDDWRSSSIAPSHLCQKLFWVATITGGSDQPELIIRTNCRQCLLKLEESQI